MYICKNSITSSSSSVTISPTRVDTHCARLEVLTGFAALYSIYSRSDVSLDVPGCIESAHGRIEVRGSYSLNFIDMLRVRIPIHH